MNDILITGGAGFIGYNYVLMLLEEHTYDHIVVVDKMTYASQETIRDLNGIDFFEGDICNQDFISGIYQKYKIADTVNFAAESHVDRSIEHSGDFIRSNIEGLRVLMDCHLKHKATGIFHQISTDEVYGPVKSLDDESMSEAAALLPTNPYAATKASADHLLLSYVNTYGLNALVTRSANNYGTYQHVEKLMPKVCHCIEHHKDIPLYGDGNYYRGWLYVKDHCKVIIELLKHRQVGVYNIPAPLILSNLELVNHLINFYSEKGHIYHGNIVSVEDRPGHDFCYLIKSELNIEYTELSQSFEEFLNV